LRGSISGIGHGNEQVPRPPCWSRVGTASEVSSVEAGRRAEFPSGRTSVPLRSKMSGTDLN
jgi:hypothetical protein